jgi:hypothetical protein
MKTHKELLEVLLAGKKVRKNIWKIGDYIYLREDGLLFDEDGEYFHADFSNISTYEIYEEPKKKIKLYLYAFLDSNKKWQQTLIYFKDDLEFLTHMRYKEFHKLENNFIEVEE